jgi:hypothetical protein
MLTQKVLAQQVCSCSEIRSCLQLLVDSNWGHLPGWLQPTSPLARLAGSPTGAASVVARTVVDDGDTIGNNQVAVLTGSAANDQVSISFNVTAADVAPGDVIEACCHVRSSGALAGLVNTITGFVDINTYVYKSASHGASLIGTDQPLNDINELIRMRITIPTGITVTSFRFAIVVQFSGAGSPVTINVGRVAVRKINRPALNM